MTNRASQRFMTFPSGAPSTLGPIYQATCLVIRHGRAPCSGLSSYETAHVARRAPSRRNQLGHGRGG